MSRHPAPSSRSSARVGLRRPATSRSMSPIGRTPEVARSPGAPAACPFSTVAVTPPRSSSCSHRERPAPPARVVGRAASARTARCRCGPILLRRGRRVGEVSVDEREQPVAPPSERGIGAAGRSSVRAARAGGGGRVRLVERRVEHRGAWRDRAGRRGGARGGERRRVMVVASLRAVPFPDRRPGRRRCGAARSAVARSRRETLSEFVRGHRRPGAASSSPGLRVFVRGDDRGGRRLGRRSRRDDPRGAALRDGRPARCSCTAAPSRIHGSLVALEGRGVALGGHSGAGKSTTALELVQRHGVGLCHRRRAADRAWRTARPIAEPFERPAPPHRSTPSPRAGFAAGRLGVRVGRER